MGRDVGGGFRMGNTCTPMEDSSQCMAKSIQYCKVKEKKKKEKRKKKNPLPKSTEGACEYAGILNP